jgi:hypothetical protein
LLPEDASFCSACGTSLAGAKAPPQPQVVYEYCEIVYESKIGLLFMKSRFWAKVTGPNGVYAAACEEKFRNGLPNDPGARGKGQNAVDEMVVQLLRDGWEQLPYNGPTYWSYQFRRAVR